MTQLLLGVKVPSFNLKSMSEKETISSKSELIEQIRLGKGRLSREELDALDRFCPEGFSMREIIEIVQNRISSKVTEAIFRSYIRGGLVSGSISRVGQKGRKYRGSQGRYPAITIQQLIVAKEYLSGDKVTREDLEKNMPYRAQRGIEGIRARLMQLDLNHLSKRSRTLFRRLFDTSDELIGSLDEELKMSLGVRQ